MNAFAQLYMALDGTTSTRRKIDAMVRYFHSADPADAAWAVYFLAGGRPGRLVASRELRMTACQLSGLPEWLFEESYQAVGDLAETISHILPPALQTESLGLARWMNERVLPLRGQAPEAQQEVLTGWWSQADGVTRFVLNKLLTGAMRVGVSRLLVIRALAEAYSLDRRDVSQRMMGYTDKKHTPDPESFLALVAAPGSDAERIEPGRPYPFFLAHPFTSSDTEQLGEVNQWLVEWKWDGIRAQLIRRDKRTWIWSRGEELISDRFPELHSMSESLPDGTVVDGELLCWREDARQPMPFSVLQQRIGRKNLSSKMLQQAPVVMVAYDLLENDGIDIRGQTQVGRRSQLESLQRSAAHPALKISPLIAGSNWAALNLLRCDARPRGVEGLMLKSSDAYYGVGRTRNPGGSGHWLKWKLDPLSVDCVLIYAQRGHGRRASLYTDYTFAVWDKPAGEPDRRLVTFAKAYSGLTDEEFKQVDSVIKKTTRERFGPVRSVEPTLVFELGFEAIQRSNRHKSGIAVRFPRMLRLRSDKTVNQADTLQQLVALLPTEN